MKRMVYILFSFFMLIPLISSCEKEIMDYEGQDGLYFDVQWDTKPDQNTDTTRWIRQHYSLVNFSKIGGFETEIGLKVAVAGSVKDYDRPFDFKVVQDSTTAIVNEEYELLDKPYIPAGMNHTFIRIKFLRTERMLDETVKLQIELEPGEHLLYRLLKLDILMVVSRMMQKKNIQLMIMRMCIIYLLTTH